MKRHTFKETLKPHQQHAARWARIRLADAKGGHFEFICSDGSRTTPVYQNGVLLADGVGMGKTWEALAAAALLLINRAQRTGGGRRRKRSPAVGRVLVVCPPGLVSKWRQELLSEKEFRGALNKWARNDTRRDFVLKTLTRVKAVRYIRDLSDIDRTRAHRGPTGFAFPPGLYVVAWTALDPQRHLGRAMNTRLRSFMRQRWDVIIVDEAHHGIAQRVLERMLSRDSTHDRTRKLLLTATPFQLEPRELHEVIAHLIKSRRGEYKILDRKPLKEFHDALAESFRGPAAVTKPPRAVKKASEETLRMLAARTLTPKSGRRHHLIDSDGVPCRIDAPHLAGDAQLAAWRDKFIQTTAEFKRQYLEVRFRLAGGLGGTQRRSYISEKLRQALSTPAQARSALGKGAMSHFPRLESLRLFLVEAIREGMLTALRDGLPRKVVVFTRFTSGGASRDLRGVALEAYESALEMVRRSRAWRIASADGHERTKSLTAPLLRMVRDKISDGRRLRPYEDFLTKVEKHLMEDTLCAALCGVEPFWRAVRADLKVKLRMLLDLEGGDLDQADHPELERTFRRRQKRQLWRDLQGLTVGSPVQPFTGEDDRKEREASAAAFQSPLQPWVLIASNVGSEGIDLQRYCEHLVHYDLEWNPARMAQREGRGDRLGRKLPGKLKVHYLVVQHSYDERMLHQVLARDRWHSVLLGKPAEALAKPEAGSGSETTAELVDVSPWVLRLAP